MNKIIAQMLYWGAHYSGFNKVWVNYLLKKRDVKLILNYHHILKDDEFAPSLANGYSHRVSSFDTHLAYLRDNYTVNLDLNDYNSITITFDDGALNNYHNAFPILEKYGLKAWFFLNDRHQKDSAQKVLWVDEMYSWLGAAKPQTYKIGSFNKTLTHKNLYSFENDFFEHLTKNFDEKDDILKAVKSIKTAEQGDHSNRCKPLTMKQLIEMRSCGHMLGFHTRNHQILGSISSEELRHELSIPEYLAPIIDNKEVLSIPFGIPTTVNQHVFDQAFDSGFKTLLLNQVRSKGRHIKGRINLANSDWRPKISSYLARWPLFVYER